MVGIIAVIFSIISLTPMLWKITSEKITLGLSYVWLGLALCAYMLWLLYGVYNRLIPVIIVNAFFILAFIYILVLKIIYERNNLDAHTSLKLKYSELSKKYENLKRYNTVV